MARIRTIKPEFPQSEKVGRLSRDARLLFIQLWTQADDAGRVRGAPRMLASLLYPYDDDAPKLVLGWLTELVEKDCIVRYEFEGSQYLSIINWLKHQKIEKPSASKLPAPEDGSPVKPEAAAKTSAQREHSLEASVSFPEASPRPPRSLGDTSGSPPKISNVPQETAMGMALDPGCRSDTSVDDTVENLQHFEEIDDNSPKPPRGLPEASATDLGPGPGPGPGPGSGSRTVDLREAPLRAATARGTLLDENWELNQRNINFAVSHCWSEQKINTEAIKFRNHWTSKSGRDATKRNWDRTWENWVLNDRQTGTHHGTPRAEKTIHDVGRELLEEARLEELQASWSH